MYVYFYYQIKEYATQAFFIHGGEPKLVTENLHDSHHELTQVPQNNSKKHVFTVYI